MAHQIEVGDLLELDVTHDRFRHLGQQWLVSAIVVKTRVSERTNKQPLVSQDVDAPPTSSFFIALEGMAKSPEDLSTVASAFSVYRTLDSELLQNGSIRFIGKRSLQKEEERIEKLIARSLAKPFLTSVAVDQYFGRNVWLGLPDSNLLNDVAEDFGAPSFDGHYDCDFEFASHCLHCGCRHSHTMARCQNCRKIRLGFELIEDFALNFCNPISEDTGMPSTLFGQKIFEPKLTDVQGPDGKWYDPFTFIELYMKQNGLM